MSKPFQFYISQPAKCPYIKRKNERKVIAFIDKEQAQKQFEPLAENGFRRSQNIAYRPMCQECSACQATRVIVDQFKPTQSMRRIWNKNKDIQATETENKPTKEQFELFQRYLKNRHADYGMVNMNFDEYSEMVEDSPINTKIIEFRLRNLQKEKAKSPLMATVLFDRLSDHLSMIYSFFEPEQEKRSLGTYAILHHIKKAKSEGLPYCHLGYWIKESPQMAYKNRFLPQQRFIQGKWRRYDT